MREPQMVWKNGWEYSHDKEISFFKEREVLEKFLNQYRGKNVIVADNHRTDCKRVPFSKEGSGITFSSNNPFWKSMYFQRRILHEGKPYIVNMGLWRNNPRKDEPQCLIMHELEILTPGKTHFITLSTDDIFQRKFFYHIIDIFDEKKILSPEAAYSGRMYINKPLQDFINNHDWGKIIEGVNQAPDLANALFIIGEPKKEYSTFDVDFGTILYQLITYRKEYESELSKKDLLELDKTIRDLRKTELLKVHLLDSTSVSTTLPTKSILIDRDYGSMQMRISKQENVANGELMEEKMYLSRVLKQFKNK